MFNSIPCVQISSEPLDHNRNLQKYLQASEDHCKLSPASCNAIHKISLDQKTTIQATRTLSTICKLLRGTRYQTFEDEIVSGSEKKLNKRSATKRSYTRTKLLKLAD
jgi:hypothetical protein